jgi:AcrR family transcriptional regulator
MRQGAPIMEGSRARWLGATHRRAGHPAATARLLRAVIQHATYRLYVDHTEGMGTGQRPPARPPIRAAVVAERAGATRQALITAGLRLFVEKGYHASSTEEIVTAAGVGTRGALYHHFTDKRALFLAVFERVQEDLLAAAARAVAIGDALDRLRSGLVGFLDASLTPDVQQILLIDGPAVLGWQRWRALEQRFGLGAIQALLNRAVREGTLRAQPLDVLAHLLLAVVDEAALFIANADDPPAARAQAIAAVDQLLVGLRAQPTGKNHRNHP